MLWWDQSINSSTISYRYRPIKYYLTYTIKCALKVPSKTSQPSSVYIIPQYHSHMQSLWLTSIELTGSLSSLGKIAWMKLEPEEVRFTIIPDQGTQVWAYASFFYTVIALKDIHITDWPPYSVIHIVCTLVVFLLPTSATDAVVRILFLKTIE